MNEFAIILRVKQRAYRSLRYSSMTGKCRLPTQYLNSLSYSFDVALVNLFTHLCFSFGCPISSPLLL